MQSWEYYVWYLDATTEAESLTAELEQRGQEGWELVAVVPNASSNYPDRPYVAFFKRPRVADPGQPIVGFG